MGGMVSPAQISSRNIIFNAAPTGEANIMLHVQDILLHLETGSIYCQKNCPVLGEVVSSIECKVGHRFSALQKSAVMIQFSLSFI